MQKSASQDLIIDDEDIGDDGDDGGDGDGDEWHHIVACMGVGWYVVIH